MIVDNSMIEAQQVLADQLCHTGLLHPEEDNNSTQEERIYREMIPIKELADIQNDEDDSKIKCNG